MDQKWRYVFISIAVTVFYTLCPPPCHPAEKNAVSATGLRTLDENEYETVVLEVIANEENKGNHFLLLGKDNDILLSLETLREAGFRELPATGVMNGMKYVSLGSLYPKVKFEIDEKESAVRISAAPELFEKHLVDLSNLPASPAPIKGENSAFLNYNLDYTYFESDTNTNSWSAPFEIGIRRGDYLFFSDFTYAHTGQAEGGGNRLVGLTTNITVDDTEAMKRYILGDITATSGYGGSSISLGGISYSRNFALSPYFVRQPYLEISGALHSPSEVEAYMNDVLISRRRLSPGEFSLKNIIPYTGAGDTKVVIRDAFGREETITVKSFCEDSSVFSL